MQLIADELNPYYISYLTSDIDLWSIKNYWSGVKLFQPSLIISACQPFVICLSCGGISYAFVFHFSNEIIMHKKWIVFQMLLFPLTCFLVKMLQCLFSRGRTSVDLQPWGKNPSNSALKCDMVVMIILKRPFSDFLLVYHYAGFFIFRVFFYCQLQLVRRFCRTFTAGRRPSAQHRKELLQVKY